MNAPGTGTTATGSSAVSITTLGAEDAKNIADLHGRIFPQPWSAADFRRLLAEATTLGLAATEAGGTALAGFAIIRRLLDEAEILTLGVLPPYRHRGVGRTLVGAISERASEFGYARIFLEVAADNPAATNLYGRMGYTPIGRRSGYYRRKHGPAMDALVLSCDPGHAGADSNSVSNALG